MTPSTEIWRRAAQRLCKAKDVVLCSTPRMVRVVMYCTLYCAEIRMRIVDTADEQMEGGAEACPLLKMPH